MISLCIYFMISQAESTGVFGLELVLDAEGLSQNQYIEYKIIIMNDKFSN